MSARRLQANRANARKSTGPRTAAGKLAISRNGLKHGILSTALFLDDERPQDFGALIAELEAAVRPVGRLESALVEKVAAVLWRQRRLIRAETAQIEQQRHPRAIACAVGHRIGRSAMMPCLTTADLEPVDDATLARCRAALAEAARLEPEALSDWRAWETAAPLLWRELHRDAGDAGPLVYLEQEFVGDPAGYVEAVMDWCSQQIAKAKDSGPIQAAVRAIRNEQAVLSDTAGQTMGRYSEMLDRELYRALKALRDAQEWRMEAFDIAPGDPESEAKPFALAEVLGPG